MRIPANTLSPDLVQARYEAKRELFGIRLRQLRERRRLRQQSFYPLFGLGESLYQRLEAGKVPSPGIIDRVLETLEPRAQQGGSLRVCNRSDGKSENVPYLSEDEILELGIRELRNYIWTGANTRSVISSPAHSVVPDATQAIITHLRSEIAKSGGHLKWIDFRGLWSHFIEGKAGSPTGIPDIQAVTRHFLMNHEERRTFLRTAVEAVTARLSHSEYEYQVDFDRYRPLAHAISETSRLFVVEPQYRLPLLFHLGDLLRVLAGPVYALPTLREADELADATGELSPRVRVAIKFSRAWSESGAGDPSQMPRLARQAASLAREAGLGPASPTSGLAWALFAAGDVAGAEQEALAAREEMAREQGKDSINYAEVENNLGRILIERGEASQGLERIESANAIRDSLSAFYPEQFAEGLLVKGEALLKLGSYREARPLLIQAREAYAEHFGDCHERVGMSSLALASCSIKNGEPRSAIEAGESALRVFEHVYRPGHPRSEKTSKLLRQLRN